MLVISSNNLRIFKVINNKFVCFLKMKLYNFMKKINWLIYPCFVIFLYDIFGKLALLQHPKKKGK